MKDKTTFPLFIVGLPRSGTKLIRDILNNHSKIRLPISESHFLPFFIRKYGIIPDFREKDSKNKFISDLINSTYFHNLSIGADKVNSKEFLEILNTNKWDKIFRYILRDLIIDCKVDIWGDKTPGYINHIELIATIFPNSRFLHIIRDPRDQVRSSEKLWNKNIYRSAQVWRDTISNARGLVNKDKGTFNYLEIKYESLIKNPESIIQRVCRFLHCDYNKSMLVFKDSVENYGDTKGELTINKDNSNKFLEHFSNRQIKKIEQIVYDVMISLEYQPITNNISSKQLRLFESRMYKFLDGIHSLKFHILDKGFFYGIMYFYRLHTTSSWR